MEGLPSLLSEWAPSHCVATVLKQNRWQETSALNKVPFRLEQPCPITKLVQSSHRKEAGLHSGLRQTREMHEGVSNQGLLPLMATKKHH